MRYFKLIRYTGDNFGTLESLIDEPTFRKYQKAILDGATHLVLEDKIFKVSQIKEVSPADEIVAEYKSYGLKLSDIGLPELKALPAAQGERGDKFWLS